MFTLSFAIISYVANARKLSRSFTRYCFTWCFQTGHETKAMMNNSGPRYKRSKLERRLNVDVMWCVLLLIVMCVTGAVGTYLKMYLIILWLIAVLSIQHNGVMLGHATWPHMWTNTLLFYRGYQSFPCEHYQPYLQITTNSPITRYCFIEIVYKKKDLFTCWQTEMTLSVVYWRVRGFSTPSKEIPYVGTNIRGLFYWVRANLKYKVNCTTMFFPFTFNHCIL